MKKEIKYVFEPQDYGMTLRNVADVAVDSAGNLVAIVRGETPVLVFDKSGKYLYGFGQGLIGGPHGLAVDAHDNIYCVDSRDHVVLKFSHSGELLMTLGKKGEPSDSGCVNGNFKTVKRGAGPFHCPTKATVAPNGEIFVTDGYGNARVHRFSADGALIKSWGEPGFAPGQLHLPHGVAVDDENRVYVADRENDRIQIFDVEGNLLKIWGDISRPAGLCIRDGLIYVAELGHRMYVDNVFFTPDENSQWSRVRVFDLDGNEVARFGGPEGWIAGNLYSAHSICADGEGSVYVGEVIWPANESAPPEGLHASLQKFRRA